MATVRVQTNIAGELVAIEATGSLGDKLAQCQTAADVLAVFGNMQKAIDAFETARSFRPMGASQDYAWSGADSLLQLAGLTRISAATTRNTPITVINLDTTQQ